MNTHTHTPSNSRISAQASIHVSNHRQSGDIRVFLWWQVFVWVFTKKKETDKQNPLQEKTTWDLSHTLISVFALILPRFCSNTSFKSLVPYKIKGKSHPTAADKLCLPSLGKWKLYCVSVYNTVSTASASDWFTASLARCRLTGRLDSDTHLLRTNLPPIAQSAYDSFSLMSWVKIPKGPGK